MAREKIYSAECPHIEVREWRPGEDDYDLMGFDTRADCDAHARGEVGPFWRRVRPAEWGPPSLEAQITRVRIWRAISGWWRRRCWPTRAGGRTDDRVGAVAARRRCVSGAGDTGDSVLSCCISAGRLTQTDGLYTCPCAG